jgi:preprotein translocase subunit YajC
MRAVQQLLFFAVLGGAMWLLILRPQRRRTQALQEARSAVSVGSSVITTAGLHATVAAVEDETVLLEIAPGVRARFARQAVVRVLEPADAVDVASAQPDAELASGQQAGPPTS